MVANHGGLPLWKEKNSDTTKLRKLRAQKTAEATRDLIGNKIADKITSAGKPEENDKTTKVEEIYISPEKRPQIIDDLK